MKHAHCVCVVTIFDHQCEYSTQCEYSAKRRWWAYRAYTQAWGEYKIVTNDGNISTTITLTHQLMNLLFHWCLNRIHLMKYCYWYCCCSVVVVCHCLVFASSSCAILYALRCVLYLHCKEFWFYTHSVYLLHRLRTVAIFFFHFISLFVEK